MCDCKPDFCLLPRTFSLSSLLFSHIDKSLYISYPISSLNAYYCLLPGSQKDCEIPFLPAAFYLSIYFEAMACFFFSCLLGCLPRMEVDFFVVWVFFFFFSACVNFFSFLSAFRSWKSHWLDIFINILITSFSWNCSTSYLNLLLLPVLFVSCHGFGCIEFKVGVSVLLYWGS